MYIFCDWLTVVIPYKHDERHHNGRNYSEDKDGKIEFIKHKRKMVEASSSARVSIRSINTLEMMGRNEDITKFSFKIHCLENPKDKREKQFDALEISGNPTKWLNRGHNIWGSDDIEGALSQFIAEVLKKADIELNLWELKQVKALNIYPSRIDLTTNFMMESENDCRRWLEAVRTQAESKYQAAKGYGTSAYFGEKSKIKTTVFYKKLEEIKKHWKKDDKELKKHYNTIIKEAETITRYEHRLHSQWFRKRQINTLKNFININKKMDIMGDNLMTLKLGQLDLSDDEISNQQKAILEALEGQRIRHSVLSTFTAWKSGEEVKTMMTRNLYFKHKKIIKEITSIDITNQRTITEKKGKVVPLVAYITGYAARPSQEYQKIMYA